MSNTKTVMGQASNQYVTPLDITDVFSTYLYTGNGSTQTITNDIDLAGEGGMVWIKGRNAISNHALVDTERGGANSLASDTTDAQRTDGAYGLTFNSNGFDSTGGNLNVNGREQASWTFRKAPKFFTCLTYTGTGSAQNISHDLGSDVGFLLIKGTDSIGNWRCWHRGLPGTGSNMEFNQTGAYETATTIFNGTDPTSTQFSVGTNSNVNASGGTYIAYLFAHNNGDGGFGPDGSDIIKCGSYTGNGLSNGPEINLGFEPQWLMVKDTTSANDWFVWDTMRGLPNKVANSTASLSANTSAAEVTQYGTGPTPTGFQIQDNNAAINTSGNNYIYMAIRRGPLAQPESGTEVFAVDANGGTSSGNTGALTSGFPVDLALYTQTTGSNKEVVSRLNSTRLFTNLTNAENPSSMANDLDFMDGYGDGGFASDYVGWMWKRAPGFFDVVAWKVDGSGNQTINHNLGVIPEMVISKNRNTTSPTYNWWVVAHKDLPGWDSANENDRHVLRLDSAAASAQQGYHRDFTDTSIRMTSVASGGYTTTDNVIAYLFATVPGVSKVGSYSGDGTTDGSKVIDCGFTSGARFVMIKAYNTGGDWMVYDTTRGIVVGNDPILSLNDTFAEATTYDNLIPNSSGFAVIQNTDGAYTTNESGHSYIFYAIA